MNEREKERWSKQRPSPSESSLPYLPRTHLLTLGERRFYHEGLKQAIGNRYLISFKVRLADVITVENWESTYGRKIAQKHLDFVLTTPKTTRIVAVIELNDATHESLDRQRRDNFLSEALHSAGIPLITFPIYQKYDSGKIRRRILATMAAIRRRRCLPPHHR